MTKQRVAQFSGPEPDKSGIFGKPGDQLQGPAVDIRQEIFSVEEVDTPMGKRYRSPNNWGM